MSDPTPAKWQTLTEEGVEDTQVLRVSGGWLYRTTLWHQRVPVAVALAFQPDPQQAR